MNILIGTPIEESKYFCLKPLFRAWKHLKLPNGSEVAILLVVTLSPGISFMKRLDEYVRQLVKHQKYRYVIVGAWHDGRREWNRHSLEKARELIRDFALNRYEADYIWFVDADNPPPKDALTRLLALDADIAGSLIYQRMRNDEPTYPLIYEYPGPPPSDPVLRPGWEKIGPLHLKDVKGKTGVIEADGAGFGCTLIKRRVFEEIPFQSGLTNSEDTEFCHRARMRGFSVKIDLNLHVPHLLLGGGYV